MHKMDGLPASIEAALINSGFSLDDVLFAAESDVMTDGRFGSNWLIVTDSVLVTFDADGSILHQLTLAELRAARAESWVGGGALVVELDADAVELAHYSNGPSAKFGYVARWLAARGKSLVGGVVA